MSPNGGMGWRDRLRFHPCVQAATPSGPDWRDSAAYAPLLEADRSLIAWEWLRRDRAYREAAKRASAADALIPASAAAEAFGLIAFEPPHLAVPHARPVWCAHAHPYVLSTELVPQGPAGDRFDVARLRGLVRILAGERADHLLLSDGLRAIRLDAPSGAFERAVCLRYRLDGLSSAEPPLLTLRRFLALCRTGHFARSLHRRECRARRWVMALRAWDGLAAGADQRRIASELFSRTAADPHWRTRESSVRSQVQRLVRSARQLAAGGYRRLLREESGRDGRRMKQEHQECRNETAA